MKTAKQLFISLLIIISTMAAGAQQNNNYEREWKNIDDLIQKKNLPRTALDEVKKIYAAAKQKGQDAQLIKALIYRGSLQQQTREENAIASIKELEAELVTIKEPAAAILKSLLAAQYLQYLQQNRWQLYNRTATTNFIKNDIATWTLEDFHKKITALYLQSLTNKTLLQATKLEPYNAIIIKGNVRYLRPTLFDLLAHEALDYFKTGEQDIKNAANSFEIENASAFAKAEAFFKYDFKTSDSLSLQHKALELYQELIRFHLNDQQPDALIDIDIERLQFVHGAATMESKDSLYIAALHEVIAAYKNPSATAQAAYLIALQHEQSGTQYHPLKDTAFRYERLKAAAILEAIVKDSSVKGEGWTNSYNLLQQINKPAFSFELEKVAVPGKPFRSLVKYKNTAQLYFKIIKATNELKETLKEGQENQYWSLLQQATPIKSWNQNLPATNDLQQHAVEIKIDALPVGEYILLASNESKRAKNASLGAQFFYVSNISYVHRNNDFFVLHRETGQPLNNAKVEVFTNRYDYAKNRYVNTKSGNYETDKNGFFKAAAKTNTGDNGYVLRINHNNDFIHLDETIYNYHDNNGNNELEQKEQKRIFFFTDRSLYRPGQTVYFKGIVITSALNQNNIATNFKTTVHLRDANYKIVDSVQLTTNEFGSFTGTFILPQNVLNGSFQLVDAANRSRAAFSVEEYKRPKFYVAFEGVKESYKVGDTVLVKGNAKGYAGNAVPGAKVRYRIVREARFPYPWLFWRGWWPQPKPMEIAHGEQNTSEDGSFAISFTAVPDKKIAPSSEPVFNYRIYADVNDIAGETRSNEYTVSAGYKSLLIKTVLAEKTPINSLKNISIRTENMNGEYQPATVSVSIFKLITEQRLVRKRYWESPDQFVMAKEEFIKLFPDDEYKTETDFTTWQQGETVYSKTDSTKQNAQFTIDGSKFSAGHYRVEITTKDKDGQEVKDVRYVELYDPKMDRLNRPEYLWAKGSEAIEPGEKTGIQVGSSAPDVFLIQTTDKTGNKKEATTSFTSINNEKKNFVFTATEADRGGYGVDFFFIKNNRIYSFSDVINVPWSNKELGIEFATFRDKTLPGSEETWTVKIRGSKGEKLAAEMLASMYDASLDAFKPHGWQKPGIWPQYNRLFNWQSGQNFSAVQSNQKWVNEEYRMFDKRYDEFIFKQDLDYYSESGPVLRRLPLPTASTKIGVIIQAGKKSSAMPAPEIAMTKRTSAEIIEDSKYEDESNSTDTTIIQNNVTNETPVQIRKNFNETAFFFPQLKTDSEGNIQFSFTAPEALTRWKLQTLAHTKEAAFGFAQKEIITQKELMVQPNAPRFLRQGDRLEFSARIINLSGKELTGQAELQLVDAATNNPVDGWFLNSFPNQYFTVGAGGSEVVKFPMEVPFQFTSALVWRVVAKAGTFSDGEEMALPVLSNKALVTETLPINMSGEGTKNFTLEKLQKNESPTLLHHLLTIEYTANPAWYAVQALPYLTEAANESTEGTWNRFYANALASHILKTAPRLKQIFATWKTFDTAALLSDLQKNQELKSALLEETPWVMQAKNEEAQKKNLALLFDLVKLNANLKNSIEKLTAAQTSNGGFVWVPGAPEDRYITQYIITGLGRLRKLGAIPETEAIALTAIEEKALRYLQKKLDGDYTTLIKNKMDLKENNLGYLQIQYLYLRSLYNDKNATNESVALNYYTKQAAQFWMKQNPYMQGMIAMALHKEGKGGTATAILKSLKETAIVHEELGMYWKEQQTGYRLFWWQAPIETQALLIEAFSTIGNDVKTIDALKTWLLKNKQTNNWRTTKATADACYALLLQGSDWLAAEPTVQIKTGNVIINSAPQKSEAGTGYFKKTIEPPFIKPEMGNITVTVAQPKNNTTKPPTTPTTWGAVYWQYFEDLDKITAAASLLKVEKKLFLQKLGDRGPVLTPVDESTTLNAGDKIVVRIELRSDRDLEYVHLKDLRASALEPVTVLSGYKWQGGLGYYETVKDASTNFYFSYLRKGTYVFEYPLFVTHDGNFSNGITTVQSMYAPEFAAHSEGVRIRVE